MLGKPLKDCLCLDDLELTRHASRSGKNSYHNFNCYRDNNHQLFNDGTYNCWSVYYCLDVSFKTQGGAAHLLTEG